MAGGASVSKVIQITNIAPQATKDQMQNLFGNIGKIDEIRLYPTIRDVSCPVISRICYVKYFENGCISVAQHLTNTVFIDRALIVIPVQNGLIPDEYKALEMASNGTLVPGLQHSDMCSKLPPEVVNRIDGMVPNQVVKTSDPKLEENNLPEYPPLPVNFDAKKIEETRRTILILDIKSDWRLEDLMEHFKSAGEIKYGRYALNDRSRFALLEFCEQKSIINAMKMQASEFRGCLLNVHHSTQPIVKPEAKSNEAAQKEIEEAMSIVKEAQSMISAAIDPVIGMLAKDKGVSRRRSRSRSRSKERRTRSRSRKRSKSRSKRSRSRTHNKRSRSRSKRSTSRSHSKRSPSRSKRSRSKSKRSPSRSKRSRSRSKRSRSRDRRKRSRSRRRSRSRSRGSRVRRTRSRTRDRDRKRSRSRDRERERKKTHRNKDDRRHRSRSRSRSRKHSPSPSRSTRSKDSSRLKRRSRTPDKRLKKILEESVIRDYDAEERLGNESGRNSMTKDKSLSPTEKSDNMDISNSP